MNHEIDCYYVFNWSVELMVMDDFFYDLLNILKELYELKPFTNM